MTPRRYLSTTLTVDNRDLPAQAESLTDEVHALRNALREAKARITSLEAENAELVRQRDQQTSGKSGMKIYLVHGGNWIDSAWSTHELAQACIDRLPVDRKWVIAEMGVDGWRAPRSGYPGDGFCEFCPQPRACEEIGRQCS